MNSPRHTVVRDPVHGDIALTAEEVAVLDTWPVQRMRGVRQLGTAHLVYPGATHTRFEHSIGTLHMVGRLCAGIRRAAGEHPAELAGIDPEAERIIRLAALVHDIGHIPFGHNLEDQTGLLERHDRPDRLQRVIGGAEVGDLLDRFGVLQEVLAVLGAGSRSVPRCWHQVLCDTLCADILDYLARDSHYTGLHLTYDPRVLSLFRVDGRSGNLFINVEKRGMLREDALSEVIRVLEARYYFSERIYHHHAKITAGALIARAVEEALAAGELDLEALLDHTDDSLVAALAASGQPRVARFASFYRRRLLPKRVAVYPYYANRAAQADLVDRFFAGAGREERRRWEKRLEGRIRSATGRETDVLLYCPGAAMQLKEAGIHVRVPDQGEPLPLSAYADRVPRVGDLERSYRELWKLYLLCLDQEPRVLAAAARAAAELLPGAVNAYTLPG